MFYRKKKLKQQQLIRRLSQPNNLPPAEDYNNTSVPHSMNNYYARYKRCSWDHNMEVDFDSLLTNRRGHSSSSVYDLHHRAYRDKIHYVPQHRFKVSVHEKQKKNSF